MVFQFFENPLKSHQGQTAIGIAVAINVVMLLGGVTTLLVVSSRQQQLAATQKESHLENLNKNAVVITKKLMDVQALTQTSALWSVPSSELASLSNNVLFINQCNPLASKISVDGTTSKLSSCSRLQTQVRFGALIGNNQKVDFSTQYTSQGRPSTLSILISGPSCTVTPGLATFGMPEIAAALGVPVGDWVSSDGFHAHMACQKLSYSAAESFQYVSGASGCSGKKINFWNKQTQSFIQVDACKSIRHVSSITCQNKQVGTCPCPQQRKLFSFAPVNIAASNDSNITYYGSFGSNCLTSSGQIIGYSNSTCPRIYNGNVERKKICELYGYNTVYSIDTVLSFTSTSDSSVAKWNSLTNKFYVLPSSGNNSVVHALTCSDPIPNTCKNWY